MLNQEILAQAIETIRKNNNEALSLSAFLKLLAPLLKENHMSLEAKDLRSWLFAQGYLQYDNFPSNKGEAIGLTQCSFEINQGQITRKYLGCSIQAQELILNNLNAIYSPIQQSQEAAIAEKEIQKAEEKAKREADKAAKKAEAEAERQKAIKSALLSKAKDFQPTAEPVSLTTLIRNINEAFELKDDHKLKLGDVKPVIIAQGLIELNAENRMVPTNKGKLEGITQLEGQNADGTVFAYPVYDQNAQPKVLAYLVQVMTK